EGGVAPSTSLHRAKLNHAVTLDEDARVRGITFSGVSATLLLEDQTLEMHGGVFHLSGAQGFSGDSVSVIEILDWDSDSDSLRFKTGNQKLGTLAISVEGDSVKLAGALNIYTKLETQSGVFDVNS